MQEVTRMGKNATIYDIAREAGVSTATVSRVINGSDAVHPQTASRVQDVMKKHAYRPSAIARGLYKKSSKTLCILLPELGNPYYSDVFSAVIRDANGEGYMLQTLYQPYNRTITRQMAQRLIEHRVDGVILNGEYLTSSTEAQLELLRHISEYMRVVLLGGMPPVPPFPTISIDLASCMEQAVCYLHDTLGHRSLLLIGGSDAPQDPYSRATGYAKAMAQRNLNGTFLPCACTAEDAYAVFSALQTLPTAVICANDLVALGVMRAARERGLQLPRDLSVIGCDNTYLCDFLPPRLTSFDLCAHETGQIAVSIAMGQVPGGDTLINGKLIMRESCAPPAIP